MQRARSAPRAIPRNALATERLVLEPVSHAHDDALLAAAVASLHELEPWMPWAAAATPATQREFTSRALADWEAGRAFHFAICESGTAAGVIGMTRLSGHGEAEISYWLHSDHVGRGLVTEAASRLLTWSRNVAGIRRVILNAGVDNVRSLAVAGRLGFTRDGTLDGGMDGGRGMFAAYRHHLDLTS